MYNIQLIKNVFRQNLFISKFSSAAPSRGGNRRRSGTHVRCKNSLTHALMLILRQILELDKRTTILVGASPAALGRAYAAIWVCRFPLGKSFLGASKHLRIVLVGSWRWSSLSSSCGSCRRPSSWEGCGRIWYCRRPRCTGQESPLLGWGRLTQLPQQNNHHRRTPGQWDHGRYPGLGAPRLLLPGQRPRWWTAAGAGKQCGNAWLLGWHWAMRMQKERASIPKVELLRMLSGNRKDLKCVVICCLWSVSIDSQVQYFSFSFCTIINT